MAFTLHPTLAADTLAIGELAHCRVLLMNDARYPWCILVPRVADAREVHRLAPSLRAAVQEEWNAVAQALEQVTGAEKINIGALGNRVPQLHLHAVARFAADAAWPGPVWGSGPAMPYEAAAAEALIAALGQQLGAALSR